MSEDTSSLVPAADEQMLDASALDAAVRSLASALAITRSAAFGAADTPWKDLLTAGVVQCFEFTYEVGWKMLKRQLERELATPSDIDGLGFRDLIRTGHERGLVREPGAWFRFRELRNIVAHTYSRDKAALVSGGAAELLDHASDLLRRLLERGAIVRSGSGSSK